jgi:methionyl-tRNA synthetase
MLAEVGQASAISSAAPAQRAPRRISIEDFAKVEMLVGEVKSAERMAGTRKLPKILVNIAQEEVRQVVVGIAEIYKPEDLIGRKVVVVANVQPRMFWGVESNGMIVAAKAELEGRAALCTFTEPVAVGAPVE